MIHLLAERGALDISDRVSDYIPEYARRGKGDTTIAHVLSHRAGVPGIPARCSTSSGWATGGDAADRVRGAEGGTPASLTR